MSTFYHFFHEASLTGIHLRSPQAYDAVPFFPNVDLSVRVLGFWFVWLFTVPSLRARKPRAEEKTALNIAFLATPLVSFLMPFITKVGSTAIFGGSPTRVGLCVYTLPRQTDVHTVERSVLDLHGKLELLPPDVG